MNKLVYIFQYPMMVLRVQNLVILRKIIKSPILVKLLHCLLASQVFCILVLLHAKRYKIGYVGLHH